VVLARRPPVLLYSGISNIDDDECAIAAAGVGAAGSARSAGVLGVRLHATFLIVRLLTLSFESMARKSQHASHRLRLAVQ